jgi:pimeloyl-ACP methyl ester carboxylesterase
MAEALANSYRVVLIDLPGFGLSPLPSQATNQGGGWDTLQYAERIKRFLDQQGITSCVLVGHSFGGRISVRLAAKYPQLVHSLVLIGSHGLPRQRTLKQTIRIKAIGTAGQIAKKIDKLIHTRIFANWLTPRFGSADYLAAGDLRATLVKTVNENLTEQASSITAPTLLLWGAKDQQTPLDLAHSYNRLISDSELYIFPDNGHEPFADVGAHLMVRYIENFLQKRGLAS